MNPKKVIIEYFDSLTNQIDIYAEQVMEKHTADEMILNKTNSVLPLDESSNNAEYTINQLYESNAFNQNPYKEGYTINDEFKMNRFDPDSSKVHNYVNRMRQEMLDELKTIEDEKMIKCEQKRRENKSVEKNDFESDLFADKLPFVIIRKEVDQKSNKKNKKQENNKSTNTQGLFQCFLIVINFYIDFTTLSFLKYESFLL